MTWWLWFGQLGTYIKGKRVVDLVHSRNSKYLRIWLIFFLPSQSLDQCKIRRREDNSLKVYTLFQCVREVFLYSFSGW